MIKIVINSHVNSTIALNHLLDSIKQIKEYKRYRILFEIRKTINMQNNKINCFFVRTS